ncbi:hypothetical protein [Croceimicrobium hydrocarbonivorans]|uniref:Uncharacterized protein n=1 Tax=Croceimicrobium hydrocarbonivorans TaxID=2761580 RepID=A0A7H0VFL9_9FLAO|nr:hypothetical protein [Croceimicrobium hydrocarbonivorans]QNR24517.1 hypothetical protein H4K34_01345 [Croceimicrobium hydrocarbonivorans]
MLRNILIIIALVLLQSCSKEEIPVKGSLHFKGKTYELARHRVNYRYAVNSIYSSGYLYELFLYTKGMVPIYSANGTEYKLAGSGSVFRFKIVAPNKMKLDKARYMSSWLDDQPSEAEEYFLYDVDVEEYIDGKFKIRHYANYQGWLDLDINSKISLETDSIWALNQESGLRESFMSLRYNSAFEGINDLSFP